LQVPSDVVQVASLLKNCVLIRSVNTAGTLLKDVLIAHGPVHGVEVVHGVSLRAGSFIELGERLRITVIVLATSGPGSLVSSRAASLLEDGCLQREFSRSCIVDRELLFPHLRPLENF
jgi:hypothetical protein